MISASPTIVALETDSAWVVIIAVSLVTLPAALVMRRIIDRPGGLSSSVLLVLPLLLPIVAAIAFQQAVLPEVAVLRPLGSALRRPGGLLHLMMLSDGRRHLVPYVFSGSAGHWLFLIGAAASSVMLLRRAIGAVMMRRLLSRCSAVGDHKVTRMTADLARRARLTRVPEVLLLPSGSSGAFAVGGRSPRILVSRDLIDELDHEELEAILAHEVAHLAARDMHVMSVAGVLRDVVAWNPLAHVAYRRLARAGELEADRRAVCLTGNALALASGLLKVCRLLRSSRGLARRTALAALRPGGRVTGRVNRLIALADGSVPTQPSVGWIPYALAACLVAVVGIQAAAGIASDDPAAFAIVLGTPTSSQGRVWNGDIVRPATPAARSHRPTKHRLSWPAALTAELQNHPVVREQDVPRWLRSMKRLATRGGLPLNLLQLEKWQADPLFSRTTVGPVGIYRVEPRRFTPLP